MRAVLTASDMISPYGQGIQPCWDGLLAGRSALCAVSRFDTSAFHSCWGGIIDGLSYLQEESLVMQMVASLNRTSIPADAYLMLATTTGEVDLLEKAILAGRSEAPESALEGLLQKVKDLFGVREGELVSSACISSTAALGIGAAMIREGRRDCVLVVACDAVTEFVFSGFSSLMALDPHGARPFDAERAGLSVGEAAGYALLMSRERAEREGWRAELEICGGGMSADANHMTGPSRDGSGLAAAIECSLHQAGVDQQAIDFISAHGTGTIYNDSMEMKALKRVFDGPRPLFSLKGGMGHSMGATGLIEVLIAARCLREGVVLPSVRLNRADEESSGWVLSAPQACDATMALSTNAGFGGVNASLVLRAPGGGA
jgi:3-oxoacyl-(acyl-carrier-protein) synthase